MRHFQRAGAIGGAGLVLMSLLFLLFCLSDWLLLRNLPLLQLSFAPRTGLPLAASLLARAAVLAALSGAVVNHSRYGRRYVSGLFQEGGTTLYASRGLGFEGSWLPRARFLCRSEVVSIDLAAAVP
jgi:hypothetical protein